jgi:hypothetical protein
MSPERAGRQPNCFWVRALEAGTSSDVKSANKPKCLTTIPLHGVEPSHVVLATRAGDRGRLVAAFRKCAEAQLTGPEPAGTASEALR